MSKSKKVVSLLVVALLMLGLMPGTSLASSPETETAASIEYLPFATVTPLSDEDLDGVSGELNPLVAGAIVGGVGAAFNYATSPGEKSVGGLALAVAEGAAYGALGGVATTVGLVAAGAKVAVSAASTAWSAWGAANVGALSGVVEHLK